MEPSHPPIINMQGDKVALGPYRRDLIPVYLRWMNDFEVTRGLGVPTKPMTLEAETDWYDRASLRQEPAFTIYERSALQPIGTTSLHNIDHRHRTAEFGILIGERSCWGQGYGTETTALMLRYGFIALDLHSILLSVYSYNERAIRAYRRAGFKEIGRWRQARRLEGHAYDIIMMDCLASEFQWPPATGHGERSGDS